MDRRAFLSLGRRGRQRVLELSCERLYVRWVDAGARAARHAGGEDVPESGEPPTRVSVETRQDLLAELDLRLRSADLLRVSGSDWLQDGELRREVESRIEAFRRKKGGVETDAWRPGARALGVALAFGFALAGPAAAQAAPDDVLRARVEAALASASDLPADSISVQVQGGVVTLSGSVLCDGCGGNATPGGVGTVQQSLGAVVRAIPGVRSLRFALRYRPPN
jgi:hypothetical protein